MFQYIFIAIAIIFLGEKWHNRRKILTPAFHFNVLQQFVTIFTQQTRDLIEKLEQHHKEPYIDIVPYITEFTLHSINGNKIVIFII